MLHRVSIVQLEYVCTVDVCLAACRNMHAVVEHNEIIFRNGPACMATNFGMRLPKNYLLIFQHCTDRTQSHPINQPIRTVRMQICARVMPNQMVFH